MPATHNDKVTVNMLKGAPAVRRKGFGIPLDIFEGATFSGGKRVKAFESNDDAQADTELATTEKAAAAAAFSQEPHVSKIKIARTTQTTVPYDNLATDLTAIRGEDDDWYGLATGSRAQADLSAAGAWTESNGKLFIPQSSDATYKAGTGGNVGEAFQTAAYDRSAGPIFHGLDTEYLDFAWLAFKLAADPDQVSTLWAFTHFAGITPTDVNATEKGTIEGYNGSVYLPFFDVNAVVPGQLASGNFIDQRVTRDWFKARAEERIAQQLLDTSNRNQKIPYTDEGLALLVAPARALLNQGEKIGHFKPGSTTVTTPVVSDFSVGEQQARQVSFSGSGEFANAVQRVIFNIAILVAT